MAHAWVAACDAGDLRTVDLLLPVVEHTALGVNCTDGAGMTGLMAALEKGRLEVVDKLIDHKDINMDFAQTDTRGRSALDLVVLSPSGHFMDLILDGLASNLVEEGELEKILLPRLLSCVTLGKVEKFKKMLDFFDINFQQGALLSFLIISGEVKFIRTMVHHCDDTQKKIIITEQNKKSFLYALKTGRCNVLKPVFSNFPIFGKNLGNILTNPIPSLGSKERAETVKEEIFKMLKEIIIMHDCKSYFPSFKPDVFATAINCICVNGKDDHGNTLLMYAVKWDFIPAAGFLLSLPTIDVNMRNNYGDSALDLHSFPTQPMLQVPWSAMLELFLERDAVFKDVDFRHVRMPLLAISLAQNRLDVVDSLLDSSYHPSTSEIAVAKDMLAVSKRVLAFGHKGLSADMKPTLLKLLYKLELRLRSDERRCGKL